MSMNECLIINKLTKIIFLSTSCSEKEASNITVYFPYKSGNDAAIKINRIRIPDSPVVYEPAMDTPYLTIAPNNLAMLELPRSLILDDGESIFKKKLNLLISNRSPFVQRKGIKVRVFLL